MSIFDRIFFARSFGAGMAAEVLAPLSDDVSPKKDGRETEKLPTTPELSKVIAELEAEVKQGGADANKKREFLITLQRIQPLLYQHEVPYTLATAVGFNDVTTLTKIVNAIASDTLSVGFEQGAVEKTWNEKDYLNFFEYMSVAERAGHIKLSLGEKMLTTKQILDNYREVAGIIESKRITSFVDLGVEENIDIEEMFPSDFKIHDHIKRLLGEKMKAQK